MFEGDRPRHSPNPEYRSRAIRCEIERGGIPRVLAWKNQLPGSDGHIKRWWWRHSEFQLSEQEVEDLARSNMSTR